jgi:hypothetical protein
MLQCSEYNSAVNMFIISNYGERGIVLCLFNLKFFEQLDTWFST